jgi:hypothetical protein
MLPPGNRANAGKESAALSSGGGGDEGKVVLIPQIRIFGALGAVDENETDFPVSESHFFHRPGHRSFFRDLEGDNFRSFLESF